MLYTGCTHACRKNGYVGSANKSRVSTGRPISKGETADINVKWNPSLYRNVADIVRMKYGKLRNVILVV